MDDGHAMLQVDSSSSVSKSGLDALDALDALDVRDAFERFEQFAHFFHELLDGPDPLREADCRESYREYVPSHYKHLFQPGKSGLSNRQLTWLRRLTPLLNLPPGTTILDMGGGYGFDSIFLASCGYEMVFCELTSHHIGVCELLKRRWEQEFGPLDLRCVLARRSSGHAERVQATCEAIGKVNAVVLDEVAHHIEPVEDVFSLCASVLPKDGKIFLLEPNFWNFGTQAFFFRRRGFRTVEPRVDEDTGEAYLYGNEHLRTHGRWKQLAEQAGFRLCDTSYIVPYFMHSQPAYHARWRAVAQKIPVFKSLAATHLTLHFEKE
ncbi:MAG: methyltransferase domain-containing protein [Planctomycetota bacterium]|nr:methyltransferase domain-containing protein [Planctomycetota bacterium]